MLIEQSDSVDLSLEAKSVLDQVVNVENQLNALTFREAEVSQLFKRAIPPTVLYWRKNKRLSGNARACIAASPQCHPRSRKYYA